MATLTTPSTERPRVLIASGDSDMSLQLSAILEGVVDIVSCSDMQELKSTARNLNPNTVMFDVRMHGTNEFRPGPALTQELVSMGTSVFLITANPDGEYESSILQEGDGDIIAYPFISSVVRARIKSQIAFKKNTSTRERRLVNLYRAQSSINEAIMRLRGENELFLIFCNIAVEYGNMELAWVGIPDSEGKFVPVASSGRATGYLENLVVLTNPDLPEGRGLSGIAFRENRPAVTNDVGADASMLPWLKKNQQYGISSIAAYPILRGGNPYAVLVVYSAQAGAFDDEIVRLLGEVAGNISFALDNFDREAARLANENRFRVIADESPFPMMIHAENGSILQVNRAFTEITGYSLYDIPDIASWVEQAFGKSKNQLQNVTENLYSLQHRFDGGEHIVRCKDGSLRTWHFISSPLAPLLDGRRSVISMAMDITERKIAEEKLTLAATVFRDSSEAMMITDANNVIVDVNQAFRKLTGYGAKEAIGKKPSILKSGLHDASFYEDMWNQINLTKHWGGDIWNRRKNGELYAARLVINAIKKDGYNPSIYVGLLSDITEKKQSEEMLWLQANIDALTGLPNRNLFRSHLSQAIRHCRRMGYKLALMFLDLDGFKNVNDTLGHNMGDLLLKNVARRLENCTRDTDIVARLGGDEFVVILTELNYPIKVERIASNILRTLSEPFELIDKVVQVSASIGIALYPDDGLEIEELIKNADQAMYVAKQAGKNRYHCCNT